MAKKDNTIMVERETYEKNGNIYFTYFETQFFLIIKILIYNLIYYHMYF